MAKTTGSSAEGNSEQQERQKAACCDAADNSIRHRNNSKNAMSAIGKTRRTHYTRSNVQ